MIDLAVGALAGLVCYALIGVVVMALTGGRDPLAFGPLHVVASWPVVVVVASFGLAAMWAAKREHR
jgi:hypothetical protein